MRERPTNTDDVIDSRDVIEAIEELEAIIEDEETYDAAERAEAAEELAPLKALAGQGEAASDWVYGETLVRDSYFEEYAKQTAIDCAPSREAAAMLEGDFGELGWPFQHMTIDWEAAAEHLQTDYFDVDFDGVTYWIR